MAAIRNGIIVLLVCALPATASAGCGPFSPCGSPSWIGFSLALPVPRLPHLHTFCSPGYQSPMCGLGRPVGCGGLLGHGYGMHNPCGCCPTPGFGPTYAPPLSSPPILSPQPTFPPLSCNPCEMGFAQTQLVPQQTISYREVPQIQYRQEPYIEQVPVTTYQQVTRMRSVPYQTMTRIPQVSTQFVPQMTTAPCNPCLTSISTPYIDGGAPMYAPTPSMHQQFNGVPEYPYPATQPQADAGQWQTIPQRQADGHSVQQMGYFPHAAPQPTRRQSMFQPAPSAATAWQSRFLR
jgi:hypothetical protein